MERKYQKYEFCEDVRCQWLVKRLMCDVPTMKCNQRTINCPYTAKEFHKWWVANGFQLTKKIEEM